jgi:uncharacterized protein (TIGR03437 family)
MRSLILICLGASICFAQAASTSPGVVAAGFSDPFPITVAPGQLLTLFVQPSTPAPAITATLATGGTNESMPVIEVNPASNSCPSCPDLLAVTVQIPFDMPVSPVPGSLSNILVAPSSIAISVNGVAAPAIGVQALADHIHILTLCDSLAPPSLPSNLIQQPCAPMITHADGTQVSINSPAVPGEELVAYALGLGQTNPALTTGQPAAASNPTVATFNLDFNFRPNALATQPMPSAPAALFAGATQGFVGLYQINFIVPAPPAGLPPCASAGVSPLIATGVFSNLTVSIGSMFSFDGAGICVQ